MLFGSRFVFYFFICESFLKDEVVVYKIKNVDFLYCVLLKIKFIRSFLKQYSIFNVQEVIRILKELVNIVVKFKDNLCFVKGCSECSMYCNLGEGGIVIWDIYYYDVFFLKCVYLKCGEVFFKFEVLEMY